MTLTHAEAPPPAPARYGTLLLRGTVGSTAYGLNHAGSDTDRLGVYVVPTERLFTLSGFYAWDTSQVTKEPDQTLHEVGKFAALARCANPTVTELLWLDDYETLTADGQLLIDIRGAFLAEHHVRNAYGGYATQQARKLAARHAQGKSGFSANTGHRTAKHGRHCLRLLHQGQHLLTTGQLLVNVGPLREELFAAGRLAETDPDAFAALFEAKMAAFNAVESILPDSPDVDTINDVLVTIRRRHLA